VVEERKKKPEELIEFFQPARPPAEPGPDVFDILAAPQESGLVPIIPFEVLPVEAPPAAFPILEPPPFVELEPFRRPEPPPLVPREVRREPREAPRGLPPVDWLDQVFHLERLWRTIRRDRKDPDFVRAVKRTARGGSLPEIPLLLVAESEEGAEDKVAKFLGIRREDVRRIEREGRDPWREMLNPTLYEVERGLTWAQPDDLPGILVFTVNDAGEFGLVYREESPEI
jgi:hypothetical protein